MTTLFPMSEPRELTDAELAAVLRDAIMAGGKGLNRAADTLLATISADYLAGQLRAAGVVCSVADGG